MYCSIDLNSHEILLPAPRTQLRLKIKLWWILFECSTHHASHNKQDYCSKQKRTQTLKKSTSQITLSRNNGSRQEELGIFSRYYWKRMAEYECVWKRVSLCYYTLLLIKDQQPPHLHGLEDKERLVMPVDVFYTSLHSPASD